MIAETFRRHYAVNMAYAELLRERPAAALARLGRVGGGDADYAAGMALVRLGEVEHARARWERARGGGDATRAAAAADALARLDFGQIPALSYLPECCRVEPADDMEAARRVSAADAQAWFFLETLGRSAAGIDDFAEIADAALGLLAAGGGRLDPAFAAVATRTVRACVIGLKAGGERERAGRLARTAAAALPEEDDGAIGLSLRRLRYLGLDLVFDETAGAETVLPLAAEAMAYLRRDGRLTGEVAGVAASPCWRIARRLTGLCREREATDLIEAAIAAMPDRAELHAHHGNFVLNFDRIEAAEAAYRRAIALDGRMGWVHRQLSICLERRGRVDEALAAARLAVDLAPGDDISRAHLHRLSAARS